MKPGIPWSVKGIEQQARAAAKQAARRSGMTIGEWLNSVILDSAEGGDDLERRYRRPPYRPKPLPGSGHGESEEVTVQLEEIAEQLHSIARLESDTAISRHASPEDQAALRAIVERLDAHEQTTSTALGAMQERLEQVSQQLGGESRPGLAPRAEDVPGYAALEAALRNIIEHIEVSETRTRDTIGSLQDRLAKVNESGSAGPGAAALAQLEQRVADLSERMAGSDAAERTDPAEVRQAEQRLRSLLDEVKHASTSMDVREDVARLQGDIDSLNQRLDDIKMEAVSERDIDALRLEIEQLAATVSQASGHAVSDLERRLEALSTRLDEPDPDAQRQVAALTERLTAAEQRLDHLATIERSVAQLSRSLEESRSAPAVAGGHSADGSPELKALEDGLKAVRASAELADRRTQDTLEAVHETLEQIVAKLAELEAHDDIEDEAPDERPGEKPGDDPAETPDEMLARPAGDAADEEPGEQTGAAGEPESAVPAGPEDLPSTPQAAAEEIPAAALDADAVSPRLTDPAESDPPETSRTDAPEAPASESGEPARPTGTPVREDYIAAARRAAQMAAARNQNPVASGFNRFSQRLTGAVQNPCKPAESSAPSRGLGSSLLAALRRGKAKTGETPPSDGKMSKRTRLIFAGLVLLAAVSAYGAHRADLIPANLMPKPLSGPAADRSDVGQSGLPPALGAVAARRQAETLPGGIAPDQIRQAALLGDAEAQFAVASRFLDGKDVTRNEAQAAHWYKQAAMQGHAAAQYRLGSMYEHGRGVALDREAALVWYQKAAERGNVKAMHNLAVLYTDARAGRPYYGLAADWFRKAAERGLKQSQFNLAVLSEEGLGVPQSLQDAVFWYTLAAAQGDAEAAAKAKALEASLAPERMKRVHGRLLAWRPLPADGAANLPLVEVSGRT